MISVRLPPLTNKRHRIAGHKGIVSHSFGSTASFHSRGQVVSAWQLPRRRRTPSKSGARISMLACLAGNNGRPRQASLAMTPLPRWHRNHGLHPLDKQGTPYAKLAAVESPRMHQRTLKPCLLIEGVAFLSLTCSKSLVITHGQHPNTATGSARHTRRSGQAEGSQGSCPSMGCWSDKVKQSHSTRPPRNSPRTHAKRVAQAAAAAGSRS